jgi:hypothetical protein
MPSIRGLDQGSKSGRAKDRRIVMSEGFTPQEERVGREIATSIGEQGGFSVRGDLWKVFAAQFRHETGGGAVYVGNNPLNLTDPNRSMTWKAYGQSGWRGLAGGPGEWHDNFAFFDTETGGAKAAAANYLGSYYGDVINSIKRGDDPVSVARAIEASPWSSDHYGYSSLEMILGSAPGANDQPIVLNSPTSAKADPPIPDPIVDDTPTPEASNQNFSFTLPTIPKISGASIVGHLVPSWLKWAALALVLFVILIVVMGD